MSVLRILSVTRNLAARRASAASQMDSDVAKISRTAAQGPVTKKLGPAACARYTPPAATPMMIAVTKIVNLARAAIAAAWKRAPTAANQTNMSNAAEETSVIALADAQPA
jgi:hypothetical protein